MFINLSMVFRTLYLGLEEGFYDIRAIARLRDGSVSWDMNNDGRFDASRNLSLAITSCSPSSSINLWLATKPS
jgi:hypothetical protein